MIQQILTRYLGKTFLRYVLVGGITFGGEYSTFILLYYAAGLPVTAANTGAFGLSLLINFSLNRIWVFGHGSRQLAQQFGLFAALATFNWLLTTAVLVELKHLDVNLALGKLAMMLIIVMWNFALMRSIIFHQRSG